MSEAGNSAGPKPAKAVVRASEAVAGWPSVRAYLLGHPNLLAEDGDLLAELGLKVSGVNVVDFGPAALARQIEATRRETAAREQLESTARANFAAQAQCQAAVLDLLESRSNADLARRFNEVARGRFGLMIGSLAVEGRAPMGWRALEAGAVNLIVGEGSASRLGAMTRGHGLFPDTEDPVRSAALIRLSIWRPMRPGILALGSADSGAFAADMADDLLAFLGRVVERTAERWLG